MNVVDRILGQKRCELIFIAARPSLPFLALGVCMRDGLACQTRDLKDTGYVCLWVSLMLPQSGCMYMYVYVATIFISSRIQTRPSRHLPTAA